jgi:hypothetical protein
MDPHDAQQTGMLTKDKQCWGHLLVKGVLGSDCGAGVPGVQRQGRQIVQRRQLQRAQAQLRPGRPFPTVPCSTSTSRTDKASARQQTTLLTWCRRCPHYPWSRLVPWRQVA